MVCGKQGWVQLYVVEHGLKYLNTMYLNITKFIQVQTSTLYLIKNDILYIDCIELCVDTIG